MPRRKKNPRQMDLTNEEIARYVFPKQVVEEAQKLAHQGEELKPPKPETESSWK